MGLNATQTASAYNNPIRAHHIGPNYAIGKVNTSAKTLSDIILLCRVPHGATIVDCRVYGAGAGTAAVMKVGIKGGDGGNGAGADTTLIASIDLATGAGSTMGPGIYHVVSLSDTDAHLGADVYATLISGTWTVSVSFDFQVAWVMKGNGS
jgi:hypothetical protein